MMSAAILDELPISEGDIWLPGLVRVLKKQGVIKGGLTIFSSISPIFSSNFRLFRVNRSRILNISWKQNDLFSHKRKTASKIIKEKYSKF